MSEKKKDKPQLWGDPGANLEIYFMGITPLILTVLTLTNSNYFLPLKQCVNLYSFMITLNCNFDLWGET